MTILATVITLSTPRIGMPSNDNQRARGIQSKGIVMRIVILCLFCLMAMGCETEGLSFGFRDAPQHFTASMTGVGLSWPAMIGVGVVIWAIAKFTSRKRKDQ